MELFDTNQYTTGTAYDFEMGQGSSKTKGKQPIYDPAWEDGSAFPGISDEAEKWKEGSRISKPNGGTIKKVSRSRYTIEWDNGFSAEYTAKQIRAYGYQIEDGQNHQSDSPGETLSERPKDDDRWNPEHFDSNPSFKADGRQLTIFLEETGTGEPPEPDDFKSIAEYEEAWEKWEKSSLHNSICAVGSAQVSRLLESKSVDLSSSGLQKSTIIAQTSSAKDSQESPTMETSVSSQVDGALHPAVSPLPHPAHHSAFKGSGLEPMTRETAFPQSSESSNSGNLPILQLKMFEDCLTAPCDQEQKNPILDFSSLRFPAAGMMSSGELFPVEPLERPFLGKGFSWWESPTALSSTGRAPGTTKLESSLIKQGILSRGQVINPVFLEESFGIPQGWTDPLECRPATELLEEEGKHSGMRLIHEWERSPLEESNTYIQLPPSEPELIPEIFSEETKKDRRRGCLYKYLENKKLKSGAIASYPRVTGERDPDNPKHWRWGFNWEEKIDGQWRNRSFGCVPVGTIPMIQSMQKSDVSLQEIIDFIRRSKRKVQ